MFYVNTQKIGFVQLFNLLQFLINLLTWWKFERSASSASKNVMQRTVNLELLCSSLNLKAETFKIKWHLIKWLHPK